MQLNPFHRSFGKSYRQQRDNKRALRQLSQQADYFLTVRYAKNMHSELSHICQKHGTDKGAINAAEHPMNRVHNYADFYEMVFGGIRPQVKHLLECGVLRGESLRAWQEYFPNAIVTGVDIDEAVLFSEERIETYQVDQTAPDSIKQFLAKVNDRKFNIIIDDGLHTAKAGITFFDNLISNLTDDGIYIIEDAMPVTLSKVAEHLSRHRQNYDAKFISLHRPAKKLSDNSLVMITKNS